jgi:hypothetical protein
LVATQENPTVDLHFEVAIGADEIRQRLQTKGWKVDAGRTTGFQASHPSVHDQQSARLKLNEMGLLTSRGLRIEFGPATERPGALTPPSPAG